MSNFAPSEQPRIFNAWKWVGCACAIGFIWWPIANIAIVAPVFYLLVFAIPLMPFLYVTIFVVQAFVARSRTGSPSVWAICFFTIFQFCLIVIGSIMSIDWIASDPELFEFINVGAHLA